MSSLRNRGGKKSGLRPVLALALSASATAAEAQTLASEEDFFGEIPVVVSATRLSQPLNATPAAVTVIDREMIEASGAVELVDILRLVPGFQVTHTHGNLFTVSAHGTGAPWFSRVQVLVSHLFPQQWEASLAWYLADETDWYLDGGLVNGCSRLDLRLAKGFRAGRADGMLELILQNLGSDYEEFTPLNRFETRVLLRGGLQFR